MQRANAYAMKVPPAGDVVVAVILALISLSTSSCDGQAAQQVPKRHKIVATSPEVKAVKITYSYLGQIHAQRHIKICPQLKGYVEEIAVKPGQAVNEGDLMFKVMPRHYQAKLDALSADAKLAEVEFDDAKEPKGGQPVSQDVLAARVAKLAKAKAQVAAEIELTTVKAPFTGVVDRLLHPQGSLVEKGEALTTLSDNTQMKVYFHVPESRYLEYMADQKKHQEDLEIELMLSNGKKFDQIGKISAIDAGFNTATGNIGFRADFPNPDGRLHHGQTGQVLVQTILRDALVIPKGASFEMLHKRYVYVVDKKHVAHRREIVVQHELDDDFVIEGGLDLNDRIVLEGIQYVNDGDQVDEDAHEP
jgi:membrane fusion protein (multidrug efflux system)